MRQWSFRISRRASIGLAAAMVASTVIAVLSVGAPAATAASNPCGSTGVLDGSSCLYTTSGTDTFTVPGYVTSATFTVYGAAVTGGVENRYGGMSQGTLGVSSGTTYQVNVGGAPTADDDGLDVIGGFNGGGDSGAQFFGLGCCSLGGAGASDVRTGDHGLTDRLFVAGGAGGTGSAGAFTPDAPGGHGGGAEGDVGTTLSGESDGTGGGGGNQLGGGASPGTASSAGFGFGGNGGPQVPDVASAGAGGGGGYYGGGGSGSSLGNPGGGGGGSGYITPLATDTSSEVGGQRRVFDLAGTGDTFGGGVVRISWPGDPITASVALTSNRTSPVGEDTVITFTTSVTASTDVQPQGHIVLLEANQTLGQGNLEPNDDGVMQFILKKNSDTFSGGSHSIVAKYEDEFGVIPNASSSALVFSIAPRSQTISFTSDPPSDAQADGSTYEVAADATSGLPVSFVIDSSSDDVCTISDSTVTFTGVGTCDVLAQQAGNASYNAAPTVTQSITVAAAQTQRITFTSEPPDDLKIGDTYTVSATGGASGNPVTFSVGENRACSIDGAVVTINDFGCEIHADQAAGNGYTAAPRVTQTIELPEQPQAITFTSTAPTTPQIGDTYTIKAKSDSTLTVALALDAASAGCTKGSSTVISGSGGVVTSALITFTGVGTCIVNADQSGFEDFYQPAPQKSQTMTVAAPDAAPTLTGSSTATGTVGSEFTYTPDVDGSPAPTVSVSAGSLPDELSLSSTTGAITGTPATGSGGVHDVTLKAANGVGSDATLEVTITIDAAPKLSGDSTATGQIGSAFEYTPTVRGYPDPTVSLSSGTLPDGVSLSSTTGEITGTPTDSGSFPVTLSASNGVGSADTLDVTITINAPATLSGESTASGTQNQAFTYTPSVGGFPDPTVSVSSGTLPAGLSLNSASGKITGTPTGYGSTEVTLSASNGVGDAATQTVTISIAQSVVDGLDPTISGTARVGQTLRVDPGSVTPTDAKLVYQWYADDVAIKKATKSALKLDKNQVGHRVTIRVTASAPGLTSATETSDPTGIVTSK